jgi:hypothetical protein
LNTLIETEGASNAVIAQGCGEFFAMVLAGRSVESHDRPAQMNRRLAVYTRALEQSVHRNAQMLKRSREKGENNGH